MPKAFVHHMSLVLNKKLFAKKKEIIPKYFQLL